IVEGLERKDITSFLQKLLPDGCPLSPFLFNVVVEPLAMYIRQHSAPEGVTINRKEYKIILYSDDIFVQLKNPFSSIPSLLNAADVFGKISDFCINWNKSRAMNIFKRPDPSYLSLLILPAKVVMQFIWDKKQLCLSQKDLKKSWATGDVGLPNLCLYYLAFQMHPIVTWFPSSNCEPKIFMVVIWKNKMGSKPLKNRNG
uniref:Reverse transcriptase domain-containing protein n=1 Tax=Chrysemys picta bellii TaxID=8478 RepID=A0A8C3FTH9_CHRPI